MALVKSIYPIIFCLLTLILQSIAEAATPSPEDVLVGSVHTIVSEFFNKSKDGKVLSSRDVTTYDPQGNKIESQDVDYEDDGRKSRDVYTYDAEGKSEEVASYGGDGSFFFKTVTFFDDKGNCTEDIVYRSDGSKGTRHVYGRDDKGNRLEIITYRPDGSIRARSVSTNTYDEQGNPKEHIYDNWDHKKYSEKIGADYHSKGTSTYDEKGRLSEQLSYGVDDSLWGRLKHALFGKWTYILNYKHRYAYDTNGYRSEETHYRGDGVLAWKDAYTYEFDSVGNWTRKTIQRWVDKNGKLEAEPLYIITRAITYAESPNDERKRKPESGLISCFSLVKK